MSAVTLKEAFSNYFSSLPSSVKLENRPEVLQVINSIFRLLAGEEGEIVFKGKALKVSDLASKEIGLFTKYLNNFTQKNSLNSLEAGELQGNIRILMLAQEETKKGYVDRENLNKWESEVLIHEKTEIQTLEGLSDKAKLELKKLHELLESCQKEYKLKRSDLTNLKRNKVAVTIARGALGGFGLSAAFFFTPFIIGVGLALFGVIGGLFLGSRFGSWNNDSMQKLNSDLEGQALKISSLHSMIGFYQKEGFSNYFDKNCDKINELDNDFSIQDLNDNLKLYIPK